MIRARLFSTFFYILRWTKTGVINCHWHFCHVFCLRFRDIYFCFCFCFCSFLLFVSNFISAKTSLNCFDICFCFCHCRTFFELFWYPIFLSLPSNTRTEYSIFSGGELRDDNWLLRGPKWSRIFRVYSIWSDCSRLRLFCCAPYSSHSSYSSTSSNVHWRDESWLLITVSQSSTKILRPLDAVTKSI